MSNAQRPVEDSVCDPDVVIRNAELFRLLRHQPPHVVEAAIRSAVRHERETVLRHRYERYLAIARRQFQRMPPLASTADELAVRWADYRFTRDAEAIMLILRLGGESHPREWLDIVGEDVLEQVSTAGSAPLFVSAHCGAYQTLPMVLAALGHRTAFLMDGDARALAQDLFTALAPDRHRNLTLLAAQEANVAQLLFAHLREGQPALLYPEFAFHNDGYPTSSFLGRTVFTPPGAEAIAKRAAAPIVPLLMRQRGGRHQLVVGQPLFSPGESVARGEVTARVFDWLGSVVAADPGQWWCWEVFEGLMAADTDVDTEPPAAREAS